MASPPSSNYRLCGVVVVVSVVLYFSVGVSVEVVSVFVVSAPVGVVSDILFVVVVSIGVSIGVVACLHRRRVHWHRRINRSIRRRLRLWRCLLRRRLLRWRPSFRRRRRELRSRWRSRFCKRLCLRRRSLRLRRRLRRLRRRCLRQRRHHWRRHRSRRCNLSLRSPRVVLSVGVLFVGVVSAVGVTVGVGISSPSSSKWLS